MTTSFLCATSAMPAQPAAAPLAGPTCASDRANQAVAGDAPAPYQVCKVELPTMLLPVGMNLDLPVRAECRAEHHGSAVSIVSDLQRQVALASCTLRQETTSAGYAGADCQDTWGEDLVIYPVALTPQRAGGTISARVAHLDEVADLAQQGRLGFAKVLYDWTRTEDADSQTMRSLVFLALPQAKAIASLSGFVAAKSQRRQSMRSLGRLDDDRAAARALEMADSPIREQEVIATAYKAVRTALTRARMTFPLDVDPAVVAAPAVRAVKGEVMSWDASR